MISLPYTKANEYMWISCHKYDIMFVRGSGQNRYDDQA